MAGAFAKRVEAKNLIITHFSSRHMASDLADTPVADNFEWVEHTATLQLVAEAQLTFGSDAVVPARDFLTIDIRPHVKP